MHVNSSVVSVSIPHESRVRQAYATTDFADAYELHLPTGAMHDPEALAQFMFSNQPVWMSRLMRLRDFIVGWFGLKTADGLGDDATFVVV
jgi:Protein of unknown function (DUF2867)